MKGGGERGERKREGKGKEVEEGGEKRERKEEEVYENDKEGLKGTQI